jgi:NAD(P)H-dependent flavin oxidoreductase YrpB (nitropropane dioxygenase family)
VLLERLGISAPIVQAGMGGGISRHELAAAVSEAGGLGTIAVGGADAIARELRAARALTGRPLAVNLLLPFARRDWFAAAAGADVVVTFWGAPRRRRVPGVWLHQCGSVDEARAAAAAGADGAILQGVEAGGHVRGTLPALELLERARRALPDGFPLLLAGGIAEREDVTAALEAGACAAVAGTRFLLCDESRAHPGYRQRALAAHETVLTELFGAGWPAPHRVIANAATARHLGVSPDDRTAADPAAPGTASRAVRGPAARRALNRLTALGARRMPPGVQGRLARAQRPGSLLLSPTPPTDDGPASLLDAGPLYAGETVARIDGVSSAARLVAALTP